MILALVGVGLVLSTAITWALLSISRHFIGWRRRRREIAVDPVLSGIPRLLDGGAGSRHTWPWALLSMLGGVAPVSVTVPAQRRAHEGFLWAESELVLVRKDGGTFVLDCLVFAELSERHQPVGVPMTLRGRAAGSRSAPDHICATLFAWADAGAPVDIAVGAEHGVAVVTLSSDSSAVALEIDEVARPH
jgi:hypothetical protein